MKQIGVVIEVETGVVKEASLGVVSHVRESQAQFCALVTDPADKEITALLGQYGATDVVALDLPNDPEQQLNPHILAQALAGAVQALNLDGVVGISSAMGKEVLPRLAAMLDAPLVMDCLALDIRENIATAAWYSGKVEAEVSLSGPVVVTGVRPTTFKASKAPAQAVVRHLDSGADKVAFGKGPVLTAWEENAGDTGVKSIADADVIISGGRGMKNSENFKLLFECAQKINAAVGASRVAVDEGWIPYAHQVGQTGEKVSPFVYIACGISGSIQHFAGMKTSGLIIAINTDVDAAIMANCDYYVHGDLFDILPELIARL